MKNLNSIRNVKKAIEFEVERMIALVENGGTVTQQTRSFDAGNDTTFALRDKEEANDYRYFPDPDLAPFHLTQEFIRGIKEALPALPRQLVRSCQEAYGLSEYDALQLCEDKATSDYFLSVIPFSQQYKAIANWMLGPVRQYLNENHLSFSTIPLSPAVLAELIAIVSEGKLSFSVASSRLLPALMEGHLSPLQLAESLNLVQVNDAGELDAWVAAAIDNMPDKVLAYKKGKKGLIGLFVGEVKKLSKGKADPKKVTALLQEKLAQ